MPLPGLSLLALVFSHAHQGADLATKSARLALAGICNPPVATLSTEDMSNCITTPGFSFGCRESELGAP